MSRSGSTTFSALIRWILGLLGGAALAGGAIALFKTQNAAGTAAMLSIGAILSVAALLGNRIESFEFGGAKVKLLAVETAETKFAQADTAEQAGEPGAASRLRASAQAILEVAGVGQVGNYISMPLDADETLILSKLGNYAGYGGTLELTSKHLRFRNLKVGSFKGFDVTLSDISSVRKGRNAGITGAPTLTITLGSGDQLTVGIVANLFSANWSKENNLHRDQMLDAISQVLSRSSDGSAT
jgi:hypothetical protein